MEDVRAVGYVRVSSDEQRESGLSVGAQKDAILAYAKMRRMVLVDMVVDAGVSGGRPIDDRKGGSRIISMTRDHEVSAVIVLKLDRLFRNAVDALNVTTEWDRGGIGYHIIDLGGQSIDTSSASGKFMMTVLAGAAEMEKNLASERTKRALGKRKETIINGGDMGGYNGVCPLGWTKVDTGKRNKDGGIVWDFVTHDPERKVIRLYVKMREDGASRGEVAEELNRRAGIDADYGARGGKVWNRGTLLAIDRRMERYPNDYAWLF